MGAVIQKGAKKLNSQRSSMRGSVSRRRGVLDGSHDGEGHSLKSEWQSALLLVILYMIQGVPLGLSMGSMPFLMRNTMSYTKIGIFTLAGYPYSFKLLWSPIVDTLHVARIGQRKSWILPLQVISGFIMIRYAGWVEHMLFSGDAVKVTVYFFVLVLLAATQDIAVDGWALTLLSRKNVGYAATCQTIGMNIGYFSSFTIFLALNDPAFCAAYFGMDKNGPPLVSLKQYLEIWGWAYLVVTLFVGVLKKERPVHAQSHQSVVREEDEESVVVDQAAPTLGPRPSKRMVTRKMSHVENGMEVSKEQQTNAYKSIKHAYTQLWRTVRLPPVKMLCVVLIVARLGMLPAESAAPLKLLEKGVSKEALASLVLIEFPIELLSALVAGRWAASSHPLRPWLVGYRIRLVMAAATTLCVFLFPMGASDISAAPVAFGILVALGLMTSFSSTLMFTALGDFYNRISDPSMGGAYLTMLNTVANIGVVVPKVLVFALIDFATRRECVDKETGTPMPGKVCGTSSGTPGSCEQDNGTCNTLQDGFYTVSFAACAMGLLLLFWLRAVLGRLEKYPLQAWRASKA
ncbi:Putative membrane protein [Picochlorum sp. SENEW3]|nr:Putative membrane protein [Picochlorum sp. SENEW3]WPT15595.1 membrane protein [Picochlorum sp. SENEW3]